jgi:hypothetical protein
MTFFAALLLSSSLFTSPQDPSQARANDCSTWQDCRTRALDAAARQDYEAFHDLAWRAVQKGPKNDPGLMTMLARAQSLSGRPLDALVMLHRLAAAGVATDAATNDDFRRVRALPGWEDYQRSLEGRGLTAPEPRASAEKTASPAATPERGATPEAMPKSGAPLGEPTPGAGPSEAFRFSTLLPFVPAGLAHDGVSDRFIVGDRDARKLAIVDDVSHRVATMASAQSAGFGKIDALEIDVRQGDLWVISTEPADGRTALHKLQLISGRLLYTVPAPDKVGPAHFTDVAVTSRSTILVLDALGQRLFRVEAKSHDLQLASKIEVDRATSLAPESEGIVYVAHEKGISRVDLASRRAKALKVNRKVDLSGMTRIRWHRGALLGVQKSGSGVYQIVRIRLDSSGGTAVGLDVLDRNVSMSDPTSATLSGDVLYYLASSNAADQAGGETIIRRVSVK